MVMSFLVEAPNSGSRGFQGLCDRHLPFLKEGKCWVGFDRLRGEFVGSSL
ncbi:hypothetical protein QJS10_CPA16g01213 [Acorus calamus]|uniref:Uncharacterized protein n=1 Tax=Acorus calamus TaxID=4465 RepID=A0AAV9CZE3_ACOCL|nr:hypothetical protein QJS10_CPA16g01213 [Acorus calamus]